MQKIHSILTGSIPLRRIHRPWNCIYFVALPFFYFFTFPALFITGLVCHVRRGGKKRGQVSCARRRSREGSKRGIGSSHFTFRPTSTCAPSQLQLHSSRPLTFYFFILFREQALKTTAAAKYFVLNDLIYLW